MKSAYITFRSYQKLSPTDEQIVFRDIIHRLYIPIMNNRARLSYKRDTNPKPEYEEVFDLSNSAVINRIYKMEKKVFTILMDKGILSDSQDHLYGKELSFTFSIRDKEGFIELYNLIVKIEPK